MAVRWLHRLARLTTFATSISAAVMTGQSSSVAQDSVRVSTEPGRRLAADAYFVIPPSAEIGETFEGPVSLPLVTPESELVWGPPKFPENRPHYAPASDTLLAMTKSMVFRHEVWSMEFGFKPVRMIAVDVPNAEGELESKLVWYLLYYVRYRGGDLTPAPVADAFGNQVYERPVASPGKQVRRFIPGFELHSTALGKRYQSSFIPHALPLIAEKERVGKPIYDSIAIQKVPVPLSTSRESHPIWGVATWTDVDPRTDFFAVEIRGLTNCAEN